LRRASISTGAVAGYFSDSNGVSHGFVRDEYGNFTVLSDIVSEDLRGEARALVLLPRLERRTY
jgi:hypothetical protein